MITKNIGHFQWEKLITPLKKLRSNGTAAYGVCYDASRQHREAVLLFQSDAHLQIQIFNGLKVDLKIFIEVEDAIIFFTVGQRVFRIGAFKEVRFGLHTDKFHKIERIRWIVYFFVSHL